MKRVLSIALAILLILSAIPMFTFADTLAQTVYYAKVGGTGDGKTYDTAAGSIINVINTINSDGHKAGDKVTVYLDSRVNGVTPTVIDSASKVLAYCGTNMPDYTCEITFTPHPDLVTSGENLILGYMEYNTTGNNRMHIGGPTVFENLTLLDLSKNGSWWAGIYNRGKSVTYRNVNFLDLKDDNTIYEKASLQREYYLGSRNNSTYKTANEDQRVVWEGTGNMIQTIVFGSYIGDSTYNDGVRNVYGDTTLVLANSQSKVNQVYLSNVQTNAGLAIYHKNVNIVMKNGCYAYNLKSNGVETSGALQADDNDPIIMGAIQVIANKDSKWDHTTPILNAWTSTAKTERTPVYKIKSNDADAVIDVTSNAGEYTVTGTKTAYVVKDNKIYYGNANVNLKVPTAGEYTLSTAKDIVTIMRTVPPASQEGMVASWQDDGNGTLTPVYENLTEGKYMLHVTNTGWCDDFLSQNVTLTKGKTYTVSFKYKFLKGGLNDTVALQVTAPAGNGASYYYLSTKTDDSALIASEKDGWRENSYTFTLNDNSRKTFNDGDNALSVGFAFLKKAQTDMYIADFVMYETDDTTKTNLLPDNADFNKMTKWGTYWVAPGSFDGNMFIAAGTNGTMNASYVDYDESMFIIPKTMFVISRNNSDNVGDNSCTLDANITTGVEYTVSFKYNFIAGSLNDTVYFGVYNGKYTSGGNSGNRMGQELRRSFNPTAGKEFTTTSDDGMTAKYTFTIDASEIGTNVNIGQTDKFRVGFYLYGNSVRPGASTQCYISDFVLYRSDDETHTNLLAKDNYSDTTAGWHLNWQDGSGEVLTNGDTTARYVEYNDSYFVSLNYGDANGDGQINILDLVKLKKMIAGNDYSTTADCSKDGKLDADDLATLKNHLLGTESIVTLITPYATENGGADAEAKTMLNAITSSATTVVPVTDKTYYVDSENGNDNNDGKSENTAIKSIAKLNSMSIPSGSVVLFKRGCKFRTNVSLNLKTGVSYGAYGTGEKPQILGSLKNYADSTWENVGNGVWKLSETISGEAGVVTFDGDTAVGFRKFSVDSFVKYGDYFHDYKNDGSFYLYLGKTNPSDYFGSIEIGSFAGVTLSGDDVSNITIENIAVKYAGNGFNMENGTNITITGCEFSWIGGIVYEGGSTRFGNAITFWNKCDTVNVSNCRFFQIYDAAFTFQGSAKTVSYKNIHFNNNLVEYTSMNLEYWGTNNNNPTKITISGIDFSNNILRFAGYGFGGVQRDIKTDQAFLLAWSGNNYDSGDTLENFTISNNIFDVANCYIFRHPSTLPVTLSNNTYYQKQSSYKINYYADSVANNQATLESAIATFDANAKYIEWLG